MSKIIVSAVFTFENGNFELSTPVIVCDLKTATQVKDQYFDCIDKIPFLKQLDVYIDEDKDLKRVSHVQWRKVNGK